MTPADITALLKDYGPWGLLGLTIAALRWIFGKYDGAQEARIADGAKTAVGLAAATRAMDDNTRATEEVAKLQTAQEARIAVLVDRLDARRSIS